MYKHRSYLYINLCVKKNSSSIKRRPTHFLGIRCDKKTVSGVIEAFPADSPLYNCKVFDLAYSKLVSCTYDICDIKWRLIKQCYNVLIWHVGIMGPTSRGLKIYLHKFQRDPIAKLSRNPSKIKYTCIINISLINIWRCMRTVLLYTSAPACLISYINM